MSKRWKIILGIAVVLALVVAIGLVGAMKMRHFQASGGFSPRAEFAQRGEHTAGAEREHRGDMPFQLEVELLDDDEDGIPDRGLVQPPEFAGRERDEESRPPQIEVELIDDDGDGVPDRGVIDLPQRGNDRRGFGPGQGREFGRDGQRGFGPGHSGFRGGRGFGPFFIIGAVIRCLLLIGVVAAVVYAVRRWWFKPDTPTPAPTPAPPVTEEPDEARVDDTGDEYSEGIDDKEDKEEVDDDNDDEQPDKGGS